MKHLHPDQTKPTPKKQKWILWVVLAALVLSAAGVWILRKPHRDFREAEELAQAGNFDAAIPILTALQAEGFEGADTALSQAHHGKAETIYAAGDYAGAYAYAMAVPCFTPEEREQYRREEVYFRAGEAMSAQSWDDAEALFISLAGHRDSADKAAVCHAEAVCELAQTQAQTYDYDLAIETLSEIDTDKAKELASDFRAAQAERLRELMASCQRKIVCGAWFAAAQTQQKGVVFGQTLNLDPEVFARGDLYAGLFTAASVEDGKIALTGFAIRGEQEARAWEGVQSLAIGWDYLVAHFADGTAKAVGTDHTGRLAVEEWRNLTGVAAGLYHTVGLQNDGTVVAAGDDAFGQCQVGSWTDVTQVACGLNHTVALQKDGTVAAAGDNAYGQCDVTSWTDIAYLYAAGNNTYGLKTDGTVVAAGDNACGQCDTEDLKHVAALAPGLWSLAALHTDAT